jgi:predicted amidohydrolase
VTDQQTRFRIAALQMNSVLGDTAANLEQAAILLEQVAGQAEIACLPEFFNVGYNLDELNNGLFDLAEDVPDGKTTQWLMETAGRLQMAVAAGLVEAVPGIVGLLYDTVVLINRQGELVGRYRKSHLYPAEHRYFRPGDELPVFELDGLRVGVATCYEAAFPPIFNTLAMQGAQVILNPSAVPEGYGYLQDLRSRARAQDNQLFVMAVNHVGDEGGINYCGRSQVANPRGEVIALASDSKPESIVAELDLALIRDQRLQEPIFRGFRPGLYRFSG